MRLGFLQDANLVNRVDWQRFRATTEGKHFASLLNLQETALAGEQAGEEGLAETKRSATEQLADLTKALTEFGSDGNESKAFEVAVSRAFRFLGFHTEHLGGAGQTDVLALADLAPGDRYRVIVDAKSSGNHSVGESAVNFDVLREHKKKHRADYVVVVGPDFANRLKNWAVDNGVVLLASDDLITILGRHVINPISLVDLRDTFTRVDTYKDEIFERYQTLERRSLLTNKILELALQEATDEDPIAGGFISIENITYMLRKEFTPRVSTDEIRESLDFLSSSFVAALEESKGRYKLADSPQNVSLRLYGLGEYLRPTRMLREGTTQVSIE